MMRSFTGVTLGLAAALTVVSGSGVEGQGRQALPTQSGRIFSARVPAGWQFSDTTNGVHVWNPASGVSAEFALLINYGFAQWTPAAFLQQVGPMLSNAIPGLRVSALRNAGRSAGLDYASADIAFPQQGRTAAGTMRIATLNGLGQAMGMVWMASAPAPDFPRVQPLLGEILLSMTCINPAQLAGRDTLMLARNNPNTSLPGIISSGEYRDKSQNWIDEQWRALRDGREPDPTVVRPRIPR